MSEKTAEFDHQRHGVEDSQAHYYEHPESKRKVVMVGMYHYGSPSYYASVKEIFSQCDLVLFEDMPPERVVGERKEEGMDRLMKELFSDSLDEATVVALRFWYHLFSFLMDLSFEGNFFTNQYQQDHWIMADILAGEEGGQARDDWTYEMLAALPNEAKQSLVDNRRSVAQRILKGDFTFQDSLGDGDFTDEWYKEWRSSYTNKVERFVDPRNIYCFDELDRLSEEFNPKFIGVKFGAAHMIAMDGLVRERGYVYQRSERLLVFSD